MPDYAIGLDLGGTNQRAAAISRSGQMLDKIAGSVHFSEGREAVMADMVNAITELREKHGAAGLKGIGIGVPGFILLKEGSSAIPTICRFSKTSRFATKSSTG
jgi:glucokinase